MTKSEFVDALHMKMAKEIKPEVTKKRVALALDCLCAVLQDAIKQGDVTLPGIGSFKVVKRNARKGRNPRTGAAIAIPAKSVVKFVPAKAVRDSIN
jgi:DNA-binding protein HU-beta